MLLIQHNIFVIIMLTVYRDETAIPLRHNDFGALSGKSKMQLG
jgi:hypothetical protein